jgi:protein kinase C substrate 80K-H
LDNNDRIDVNEFITGYYEKISPHLNTKSEEDKEAAPSTEETPQSHEDEQPEQSTDYETTESTDGGSEQVEESNEDSSSSSSASSSSSSSHDSHDTSRYDEDTQRLIEEAQAAKQKRDEVDSNIRSMESDIESTRKKLELDVGPNGEFADMIEKCFEYEDREYIYKLCPYDRTVQKSKSSQQETTIGNWKSWNEEDPSPSKRYMRMRFDNGLACWNGPSRNTNVIISCGVENKVVAVSEPNRCEVIALFLNWSKNGQ